MAAALEAVARACQATMAVRRAIGGGKLDAIVKEDRSPVTVADFAAQAVVAVSLGRALGREPLVGEESTDALESDSGAALRAQVAHVVGAALGESVSESLALEWIARGGASPNPERFWTLDPVDGTKGFLRGGQFAVALALIERGEVQLAALGCPAYEAEGLLHPGVILGAERGKGAFEVAWQGTELGSRRALRRMLHADFASFRMCESVESGHTDQGMSERIVAALGMGGGSVRMDSQAKYAALARGDADVYLRLPTRKDYREKIWDHAAGALVVLEAGGCVTDVDGKALDFSRGVTLAENRGVVASFARDHGRVVAAVQSALR